MSYFSRVIAFVWLKAPAGEPVQIGATRKARGIPRYSMRAGMQRLIYKTDYFLSHSILDRELYTHRLWQLVTDRRG